MALVKLLWIIEILTPMDKDETSWKKEIALMRIDLTIPSWLNVMPEMNSV